MNIHPDLITLDTSKPIWDLFFRVAPLVVIGSKAEEHYDLAPKHLVMPLGWDNYFCFVCSPSHQTYINIELNKCFAVSFVNPDQIVLASLTALPKCTASSSEKSVVKHIPTFQASNIDALFLKDGYMFLECELHQIIDGFGPNSLIIGKVNGAHVAKGSYRISEKDDGQLIKNNPLLVYLDPGRFAKIEESVAFPFPKEFKR